MDASLVPCSPEAATWIARLAADHGPLMFHLSGGCCDGSQPMCFAEGEFRVGSSDVLLGHLEGYPFYMAKDQHAYWKHNRLSIDIVEGRGSSFSLEIPHGVRFILKSSLIDANSLL